MIIINEDIKNFVHKKLMSILPENSGSVIHGTFASGKSKFVSDIDLEIYLNIHLEKNKLVSNYQKFIKNLNDDKDVFFIDTMVGLDKRYDEIDIELKKDLSFPSYNYEKCMKYIKTLLKNKIITKKEFNELSNFVVKNPSYMQIKIQKPMSI